MQSVLIVIHLMVVIVLVATVLLQRSEGGALGVGSTAGFLTGRGQANALTRATAILAALFFATSLGLTILARLNQGLEVTFQSVTPVETGTEGKEREGKPSLLEQLRRIEDQQAPQLPSGVSIPGQEKPQGAQSIVETGPGAPGGLNLPQKQPVTPLTSIAPGTEPQKQPAPARPLPFKPGTPEPLLPGPK
ncbi:MAG TPA: preprotein translocase subunit SecG [Methylocella sp.]|nr:preprotein translocase subunit SecG [Methylocella sp.]